MTLDTLLVLSYFFIIQRILTQINNSLFVCCVQKSSAAEFIYFVLFVVGTAKVTPTPVFGPHFGAVAVTGCFLQLASFELDLEQLFSTLE